MQSAFESADANKVLVLVISSTARASSTTTRKSLVTTPQRIELTMVKTGSSWLASNFVAVGIQWSDACGANQKEVVRAVRRGSTSDDSA